MSRNLKNLLAGLFWLGVWQILAMAMGNPLLLPSPWQVLLRLGMLAREALFWKTVLISIGRILLGLVFGLTLGILLAVGSCLSRFLDVLIQPAMAAIQAVPVASFAILVLIWLDRDLVPALICAMMVLPVVYGNVCAGIRSVDRQLLEMARVFRLGPVRRVRRFYIPTVLPYFRAACTSGLGLGWKAGIAAEVLTVPASSIGRMISEAKQYLMTEDLFAWTLLVVVLSLLLQSLTLKLLRGRRSHAAID